MRCTFRCRADGVGQGERVVVVGDADALGGWAVLDEGDQTLTTSSEAWPTWFSGPLVLPAAGFRYRYAVVGHGRTVVSGPGRAGPCARVARARARLCPPPARRRSRAAGARAGSCRGT